CTVYLSLSCMALDYLTIPGDPSSLQRLFNHGHLIVMHMHSHLSAQTTCVLLCLGVWSLL
ncbi:hypothetical protein PAXRUDRAFT_97956, partial [Paxillus rubicundulus Ve08.2h10]